MNSLSQRANTINIAQPAISCWPGIDYETEWPTAACGNNRQAGSHGLQEDLAEWLIVGWGHENIAEVEAV